MDLNSTKIFVYVVSRGSFTKAAEFLKMPVATVSRKVADLENELNLRLLERSTRHLRLTDAGMTLYEYASRGLEEMEAGHLALTAQQSELRGKLRLSLPPDFKPMWKLIAEFQKLYHLIDIEVFTTERKVDYIQDGVDLSLRIGATESLSSIARLLHRYSHKLIASKSYIEAHPSIKKPKDLYSHQFALWSVKKSEVELSLGSEKILITPKIVSNSYGFMLQLAQTGNYITELPNFLANPYINSGEFVEILPKFPLVSQDINLVYPSRKQLSRISRVFIDFCTENFEKYLNESNNSLKKKIKKIT